ncbi:TPA: hypothetical protein ACHA31_001086, partial [Enterococcus faecium]
GGNQEEKLNDYLYLIPWYINHFLYRLIMTWIKIKRHYVLIVGFRVTEWHSSPTYRGWATSA